MADGPYRFQQPGTGPYYYQQQHNQQLHHQRHIARNGSPVNGGRAGYNNETPSPSRSPVSQQSTHTPFSMFNQSHQQGQHGMMNGGAGHQRYLQQMNASHKYQQHPHQQQGQQNHHHQQNHGTHAGHGGGVHQHTFSSGTLSHATPNFTPRNLHNPTPNNGQGVGVEPLAEHWQHQMQLVTDCRSVPSGGHHHSRKAGAQMSRDTHAAPEDLQNNKEPTERNRAAVTQEIQRQDWDALDLSGQGLRAVSRVLFCDYLFLDKLFLDHNKLSYLPSEVGQLRSLSHLDVSSNDLKAIPERIGMLINLKSLLLFDNDITTLPQEVGYLYQLETLGIEGNPLQGDLRDIIVHDGTRAMVTWLRDGIGRGDPPNDRDLILEDDTETTNEIFSVLDYNILCDKYVTATQYPYTPSDALVWDYRRDLILKEIKGHDADVVCLQELDQGNYNDVFRRELAYSDYKGVYWPKSRARTMPDKEARLVDGCATFYKGRKYVLLDKQLIDFANTAINRPDMKGEHDIFNRVMPRDNIAVVTFLENRMTGSRIIVVNAHLHWDPAFTDVIVVQTAILLEQISKFADQWASFPPCTDKAAFRHSELDSEVEPEETPEPPREPGPSLEYSSGSQIPVVICGDFNSIAGSGVHELLSRGGLPKDHLDLANRSYGNFTRDGMTHPLNLKSAYGDKLSFTNYTPGFVGAIDYIWHSSASLRVRKLLGEVDDEYLKNVPGFPSHHFPSDHLPLFAEFSIEPRKERKVVEADFGPQKDRRH